MKHKSLTFALVLLLLGGQNVPRAQTSSEPGLPKGVERGAMVEGITEYRLPNGLRVLLFPDPSKQTITVNITYLVGSRHENYGETGMAHLLEHLLFKGSTGHPEFVKEADARGAQWNGTTSVDRTNYFETLPATEGNLKWALDVEADRMVNAFIAKRDLDSEMTVVRNEFEAGENDPLRVLAKRLYATAYQAHNYGKATIGTRSDIENVPIERLRAFYQMYYQPDNAVLLIAGRFDEARALDWINQYFTRLPKPARALPKLYTSEPDQDGERLVTLRRTGDVQGVLAGYHIPSGAHAETAAIAVLAGMLTDSPAGRLHQALVESGKASRIINRTFHYNDPSLFVVGAEARQESSLDAARETLLQVVESVATEPPTKEEVERIRNRLLKDVELRLNASDTVGIELSNWISKGDWRLLFLYRDRLEKVTPEAVRQAAASYLKSSNRTVGVFIPTPTPDRARIPAVPDVQAMVKDYNGKPPIAPGEAFDPSATNIHARTTFATASSGLKLALLPKKTRGKVVVVEMTLRFGDEKSLMNRVMAGRMTSLMLLRGTTKHTRQQLQDKFDNLKAKVSLSHDVNFLTVSIETTRDQLPAVMRLVAEALREPSFPAAEFEQLRQEWLSAYERVRTDPEALAMNRLQRLLSPYPQGDPRAVALPDESIAALKALTVEDVQQFHANFFGGQVGECAVVGDFDDKAFARLADDLFRNWNSKIPYARLVKIFRAATPSSQTIETPDKANAFFVAGMNLPLRNDDLDRPALDLANWMLGGGGQTSNRLMTRIRQKEGLSYGGASWIDWDALNANSPFLSAFICAPQNLPKVETAYKEELARALRDGFTAEELAVGKAGYKQTREVARADDKSLVGMLAFLREVNRTPLWYDELEKSVQALTLEQVNAALRKYLDPNKLIIIQAGDLAKSRSAIKP